MSATAWPDGVIARYLTVGSATVDITDASRIGRVTADCRGCTWHDYYSTGGYIDDTAEKTAERVAEVLPAVRKLAQDHAETCRALPNPNGVQS